MKVFLEILGEGYTQSLILIVTVAVTAIIYFLQKRDEKRNAARMIVMQIDSLNSKVDSLMRTLGKDITSVELDKFWQTEDILEESKWDQYKQLFVKKLNYNEIISLNNYYANILSIGKQQEEIKNMMKLLYKKHFEDSIHISDTEFPQKKFHMRIPTLFFQTMQNQYESIMIARRAVPYDRLKKITNI